MARIARAVLVAGALLSSVLIASTSGTASAGDGPPPTFNELYRSIPMTVNGDYTPLFGLACGAEEGSAFILWYAPGGAADFLWTITDIDPFTYSSKSMPVNGTYQPIVGDFDGNGCDDILWYAPGGAPDFIWWGESDGSFTSAGLTINGTYEPVAGVFGDNEPQDIFWYAPGSGGEWLWEGGQGVDGRTFKSRPGPSVNGTYEVEAIGGSILFHKPGPGTDYLWGGLDAGTGAHETQAVEINGTYSPQATWYGFLLYGAGGAADYLLYEVDEQGKPSTIPGTINGNYVDDVRSPTAYLAHVWHAPGSAPDFLWVPASLGGGDPAPASVSAADAPDLTRR